MTAEREKGNTNMNMDMDARTASDLKYVDLSGVCLQKARCTNLEVADLTRAYLRGADLSGEDLKMANLKYANLEYANLHSANLYSADLCHANLHGANLTETILNHAKLDCALLSNTNLEHAYLSRASLCSADLSSADLSDADLYGADLSDTNLEGANLTNTNLIGANLRGTKLDNIIRENAEYIRGKVLNEPIIGYKKCAVKPSYDLTERKNQKNVIVKLEIPKGAVVFCINGSKCRTNKAKVLSIFDQHGGENRYKAAYSITTINTFTYEVGETIEVMDFDTMYNVECSTGIHFFMTEREAIRYPWG